MLKKFWNYTPYVCFIGMLFEFGVILISDNAKYGMIGVGVFLIYYLFYKFKTPF